MSPDIKVTDKRIFREDGELREEYRYLEEEGGEAPSAEAPGEAQGEAHGEARGPVQGPESTAATTSPRDQTPEPGPGTAPSTGAAPASDRTVSLPPPRFLDLVGILAEPATIYLGDVPTPDGQSVENLPVARFHIDLLDVLLKKTEGNLDEAELAVLEDIIYRLRLRYVEKTR